MKLALKGMAVLGLLLGTVALWGATDTTAHSGHVQSPVTGFKLPYSGSGPLNVSTWFEGKDCTVYNCNNWLVAFSYADSSWENTNTPIFTYGATSGDTARIRVIWSYYGTVNLYGQTFSTGNNRGVAIGLKKVNGVYQRSNLAVRDQVLILIRANAYPLDCINDQQCWFAKQYVIAHEMGHALGLDHVPQGTGCGDSYYYQSVMDYDCEVPGGVNGPTNLDQCGIQHIYYNPNYSYENCGFN